MMSELERTNFPDYEEGIDFLEGVDDRSQCQFIKIYVTPNLNGIGRALLYYIEPETGHFVQRISEAYTYPTGNSSTGYGEGNDAQVKPAGPGY